MNFKVGDRVVCINPEYDGNERYEEWVNCVGVVVDVDEDDSHPYEVEFDNVPEYYTQRYDQVWYCKEDELDFEPSMTEATPIIEDLI